LENGSKQSKTSTLTDRTQDERIYAYRLLLDYLNLVVFSTYRQLWALIVAANVAAIAATVARSHESPMQALPGCTNAAVANILLAILVRQDYMKNLMYYACWSVPPSAPLWLRKKLAFVYEKGGVHSGAAISSCLWLGMFTGYLWAAFKTQGCSDFAVLTFDVMLVVLLLLIVITAIPQVRRRYHDMFEVAHRFAGWVCIALFWFALIFSPGTRSTL